MGEAMNCTSSPDFELAGVNLERPFLGCNRYSPDDPFTPIPSLDCLKRGLGEWQQNVTAGKRDSASVFRSLRSTVFLELLASSSTCDTALPTSITASADSKSFLGESGLSS